MFDYNKSKDFFDPQKYQGNINIIGCGAVGSGTAELLSRLGVNNLTLWDDDIVEPHNLANQIFRNKDIGKAKTFALTEILSEINPEINITTRGRCTPETRVNGYIFLCIDNIDTRRELCQEWQMNPEVKWVCDGRMGLTSGNIHTADFANIKQSEALIASMDFSHEDAIKEVPVNACGMTLSVVLAPRMLAGLMVAEYMNFRQSNKSHSLVIMDAYQPDVLAFNYK